MFEKCIILHAEDDKVIVFVSFIALVTANI